MIHVSIGIAGIQQSDTLLGASRARGRSARREMHDDERQNGRRRTSRRRTLDDDDDDDVSRPAVATTRFLYFKDAGSAFAHTLL